MNNINPQVVQGNSPRVETHRADAGGERTDAPSQVTGSIKAQQIVAVSGNALPRDSQQTIATEVAIDVASGKTSRLPETVQLENAVARLNDYIQSVQRDLEFSLDESSGRSVISVIDRNSAEVIRQIPNDVTLQLAQNLNNEEPLNLFSAQV